MKKAPSKKLVVFTIGGKGGPGKSWVAGLLLDWYQAQNLQPQLFELDNENSTTIRFQNNPENTAAEREKGEAEFIDISQEQRLDYMIHQIMTAPLTLIDMRAGSTDRIGPWWRNVDTAELSREHGVQWTGIGLIDSSLESITNIGEWAKDTLKGDKEIRFVAAINHGKGGGPLYLKGPERIRYRDELGIAEIEIPALESWVHEELENSSLRVGKALALEDPESPLTMFMNRARLKRYQQSVFAEFDKIKDRLLP